MTGTLSGARLSGLSGFIADRLGLHFPPERWADLERAMSGAAKEFSCPDTESCIQWLLTAPLTRSHVETLAGHLTVGETYFFRDRGLFEVLEGSVLPQLIAERRRTGRRLRIWSAGCSGGEEPYSLAITLSRLIPDWEKWHITILGTDINPRVLRKASQGIYSQWSFRDSPPGFQERYFTATGQGRFALLPEIRGRVFFSHLNLADDAYPSLANDTVAMDLIFCRNVLMYFTAERAAKVIDRLGRSLVEGGWLVVSPVESGLASSAPFLPVRFSEATLFQKDSSGAPKKDLPGSADLWPATPFLSMKAGGTPALPGRQQRVPAPPTNQSPPDLFSEALALYEKGCYTEAAGKISVSLSLHGGDSRAEALLARVHARVHANEGRLPAAMVWCEKAIAGDKLNPASYYLRALILQEGGVLDGAVTSLKHALYLDQQFAPAHFALANLSRRQGRRQESEKHSRNALAVLSACPPADILPESDGITAGRLAEMIRSASYARGPE